jgi:tetratricopeptide (TPR) repeat protein
MEHISTLDTVNSLGVLYADLGRLDEAEKMYQRALGGFEKRLGYEHERCHSVRERSLSLSVLASLLLY